jgi:hypothetical protein
MPKSPEEGMEYGAMLDELQAEYPAVKEEVESLQAALDAEMPEGPALDAAPADEEMPELPPMPLMGMDEGYEEALEDEEDEEEYE